MIGNYSETFEPVGFFPFSNKSELENLKYRDHNIFLYNNNILLPSLNKNLVFIEETRCGNNCWEDGNVVVSGGANGRSAKAACAVFSPRMQHSVLGKGKVLYLRVFLFHLILDLVNLTSSILCINIAGMCRTQNNSRRPLPLRKTAWARSLLENLFRRHFENSSKH